MRYRWFTIVSLFILWGALVAGCSPATSSTSANTPPATARTPAPTRYYDVAPPPATATARAPSPTPAAVGGIKLTILHTNDSRGYVDPCG